MVAPLLWATLLRCPATSRIRAVRACDDAVEAFEVGQRVRGLYGASALGTTFGCKWFDGEIVADNGGTYRVQYDDGDVEDRVQPIYLRATQSTGAEASPSALEAQAAASRRRRKEAQREAGGPLRALESRLNILGLGVTLVDDAGDAILPDALIAVAVLGALQLALLSALFQPLTTAVCALPTQGPLTAAVCAQAQVTRFN